MTTRLRCALMALLALLLVGCQDKATPAAPTPTPTVSAQGQESGLVPWDKPLSVTVSHGVLRSVSAHDSDGQDVAGTVSDQTWTSTETLTPDTTYRVNTVVVDAAGRVATIPVTARTTPPARSLHAVLSPGDGKVVGVGMPVIATLDQPITSHADRQAIEARMTVTTDPPITGAWRWMSPTELHYRGADYWPAHTHITVNADLRKLQLSQGTWGYGDATTDYSIGRRVVATVDVTKHTMDVVRDGVLLRTVKVSTGRDKYPTKGGVHLVLEKTKLKVMDSATVGIPRNSPDGYYEKVPNSVRISYGGAFVHSADWSVRDQGVRNVSHGCVNISPADAAWFFDLVIRGDVVDIIHASAPPKLSDPGMSDWNIPFSEWGN